jgi:putative NADH-flavin reductase
LGGLGILDTAEGKLKIDDPEYPKAYLNVGKEHLQAYLYLKETVLDWTIIGSPDIIDEEATGNFLTSADKPATENGKITAGDLGLFMVSEAVQNKYVRKRVGISNMS